MEEPQKHHTDSSRWHPDLNDIIAQRPARQR
jgi:hypothetical protein